MANTIDIYTGDGTTVLFSVTFPYISQSDVEVTVNGFSTSDFTFANANTIEFNTPPDAGDTIAVIRKTDISQSRTVFAAGSPIRASDLNQNNQQLLFSAQETNDVSAGASAAAGSAISTANQAASDAAQAISDSANAVSTSNQAASDASSAVSTANQAASDASNAVSTANQAASDASNAVSTANQAANDASNAVSTANDAASDATTALNTANQAASDASDAVNTANDAANDASIALNTANDAASDAATSLSQSGSAVTTANAAAAAVAAAVFFTPIPDLATLLTLAPDDGDFFELSDSTGAESEPSIVGVPAGLVGDPGLTFRLSYSDPPGEFVFLNYFANNSEERYANVADGVTGAGSDRVFLENEQVVTTDYTITTNKNALTTGDVAINSGITVTVPVNSTWVIL